MVRKILAVIFSLCMALAVAPIVRAEETEITTAQELDNLFRTGGSGKLMNEIPSSTYTDMPVLMNTDLDMNGYTINVSGIIVGSNVTLTLRGKGNVINTTTIAVNSRGELHADNSVTFSTYDYGFVNLKGGTLNGGAYNMRVQCTGNEDTIQNGAFTGNIENFGGSIIINNGTFANNKIYVDQGQSGSITINNGTFNSGSSIENSTINGGTFNAGSVITNSIIYGGTFNGNDIIGPTCTVVVKDIGSLTIVVIPDQTYSGADLVPDVTIKDGENTLVKDQDYTVAYSDNHNAGTATVVITGIGKYKGTVTKTFAIKAKEVSVSGITAQNKVYDGTTTAVLDTSNAVVEGKISNDDVSVNASGSFENADAGTGKTINFTQQLVGNAAGNYVLNSVTGTVAADISKANPFLSVEAVSTKTYSDDDFQLNVSHQGDGKISFSSGDPVLLTVSDTGLVHIAGAGTASITVNLEESKNYTSASDTLNINVDKANGSLSIQNAVINKTYGDADFSVKPSDSTPGTIRYTADGSGVVSVDGNGNVHINKAGTAVITVSMDATGNHHAVSETITINVAEAASPQVNDNYVITTGNMSDWQSGSNTQLVIISDGDYDLFAGLYVDGSLLDPANYEVRKGSTEIYLQPSYLETLTVGKHIFELRYSNGKTASGEFTIVEAETNSGEGAAAALNDQPEMNITLQPKGTQKVSADGTIQTSLGDGTYYDQNYVVWDGFGNKVGTLDISTGNVIPVQKESGSAVTVKKSANSMVPIPNTGDHGLMGQTVSFVVSMIVAIGAACVLKKY